jgi:hypothetical protein
MATPNINLIFQALLVATNNLISPPPQIMSFDFGNPTLGATQSYYDSYLQASEAGTVINLPASPCFAAFVQNLSPTAVLKVTVTPNGNSPTQFFLGPGGVWLMFDPSETSGGGITALTLTGAAAIVPAAVLVAA